MRKYLIIKLHVLYLGDGAYNISVTAYYNQDEGHEKIPILVSHLDNPFYVESFPNISFPKIILLRSETLQILN